MAMAAAGLPKTGRIGFELFDKTNLGATDFTEQVNYRRALEGELERSVMSLAEVEQARVHLTFPKESIFLEQQQPAKASVLVRLRAGARLTPQNVLAIDHLVASAVEGLSPDAVTVLDMNGNLLGRPEAAGDAGWAGALRSRPRLPAQDGSGSGGQDRRHARTAARGGEIPCGRLGGVRFHRRRAERGDLRSGAVGDGEFAEDRGQLPAGSAAAAFRERPPRCRVPPRGRERVRAASRASRRTSLISPAAR